ncbi:hypothetical protein SAMN05444008_10252 [Cnuella takakiae]|uniref:Lipoprotein n=1 Tax=Cnuella takakiae TaxID=1302690 RepID=A0A1M4UU50_9BACT|nr:hypothetical protein [Cnuella takakiae]OLY92778.1 hypothetical protein BUE76_13435 [Cnuella takakiae]SHE60177.1 hypothetical protein SAMN05444008_10252 [Cnuella takakiae]
MFRFAVLCTLIFLSACGSKDKNSTAASTDGSGNAAFASLFQEMKPPYTLSDSGLLANKDTVRIRSEQWNQFIPDSITKNIFGATTRINYTPLASFKGKKGEQYFLVKAARENRSAALMVVAAHPDSLTAVLPFLVPDKDAASKQVTSFEGNFSVIRTVHRTLPDDSFQEGKDVFAYSELGRTFDLVMTDPLSDEKPELINPIDTLGSNYTYAGDYSRDKRNIVSVRDGRKKGLITVFIHMEAKEGTCTGEIKGDAEIVDGTTAIYRTPGDPCILTLKFGKGAVTLQEQEGCGSRRGLECSFNGTFKKKKEADTKETKRK